MRKGMSLVETVIATVLVVVLTITIAYVFRAVILSWAAGEGRLGLDINLDRGMFEMVRDLREAKAVSSVNSDELRFTTTDDTYHIYYFYNASDAYPPTFNQSSYEIRKATLDGSLTAGLVNAGRVIVSNVLPPSTSDLSYSSNTATITLGVKKDNETLTSSIQVRPRNL